MLLTGHPHPYEDEVAVLLIDDSASVSAIAQRDRIMLTLCAALLIALTLLSGCDHLDAGRQVRTKGILQAWVHWIDEYHDARGGWPERDDLVKHLDRADLVDPWGSPIQYAVFGSQYVVASLGRDGKLDVGDLKDYLAVADVVNVNGEYERDIVSVNGRFIRNAGK